MISCKKAYHELCLISNFCQLFPKKGEHDILYKREPTMTNAMKPYYTVDFKEDNMYVMANLDGFDVDVDSYYVFTYKEPYDD